MASASLAMWTGAVTPFSPRTRVSSSARRTPLSWVRLGESSTTPKRTMPGTATPMASIWASLMTETISLARISTTSLTGRALRASTSSVFWGKRTVSPTGRMSSSLPATMCSVITAPIEMVIAASVGSQGLKPRRIWSERSARLKSCPDAGCISRPCAMPCWLVHLVAVQTAEAVEGGGFVALGQGWVVEDCVNEVVDRAAEDHDGLTNVDEFAGAFADDVDAEDFSGVAMKDQL